MLGKLHIEFSQEEGMDAGGLTREWFLLLSKEIFNPNYALFLPSANGNTFQPSPHSKINPDHLRFFKFVGRFIAKALHDGYMLDAYFTRAFYKHILGQPLSIQDMEDIDPEYYKNLTWILDNDITLFDLTFSYEADEFGYVVSKELIPNGSNIAVTEQNKKEYVKQIC
jgi:E3 ubiquitin-protein ligase HUWE1